MIQTAPAPGSEPRRVSRGPGQIALLSGLCLMATVAAFAVPHGPVSLGLIAAAGTLAVILGMFWVRYGLARRAGSTRQEILDSFIEGDAIPCLTSDGNAAITGANAVARAKFGWAPGRDIGLATVLANVLRDPGPLVLRLQARAEREGRASEEVVALTGHVRLSVTPGGGDLFYWRLEQLGQRPGDAEPAGGPPMLVLGRRNTILFMNEAARELAGGRIRSLDRLLVDLPPRPGELNTIRTPDGPRQVMVGLAEKPGQRQELFLLPAPAEDDGETQSTGFSSMPVPLLKLAPDGRVLLANAEARRLLGRADVTGQALGALMEGLGRPIQDWLQEAADGRDSHKSEFLRLTRNDRETFVQVTLRRVDEGEGVALFAVLNDATELKTLEAQFVQSQKMQAIGQLAGGIAHDFNNLLTAISGHCDLLLLHHDQADPDYADLVQINQNANRAAALVGQLLAYSRKQTLQPEMLDLRETLSDLTHLLNRLVGERVELVLNHDPLLPTIRADKRQLEQVMMNLVVNARDAMQEGGEIRVETEVLSLSEPLRRDRAEVPPGDYVCVRVNDAGVGIEAEKLQKVFEPFFTTKRTGEGTGLGLSTVYGIVKQTGGFIFVDSEVGSGTCVTLLFPVWQGSAAAASPPARRALGQEASAQTRQEAVVLLVEDEAPVRAFASRALKMRGYTVLEAESAEAALETLRDDSLEIDVFVTDVIMPGLDGPSWVRQALETRPDTKVVFVSGYAEAAIGENAQEVPNSVFLPKPFSLTELTDTVRRQIA